MRTSTDGRPVLHSPNTLPPLTDTSSHPSTRTPARFAPQSQSQPLHLLAIYMATVYDVLGVIFGITSLLAVVEQARRLIDARLPPGRLRDLQDALAATCMLVERLERIGCLEDVNVAGTYRNRITE